MSLTVATTAIVAAVGALWGFFALPALVDALLQRKYRHLGAWWDRSALSYRRFKARCPHREPDPRAAGSEGALGLWYREAGACAAQGLLPAGRAQAFEGLGGTVAGAAQRSEADERARYRCLPSLRGRIAMAVLVSSACLPIVPLSPSPLASSLMVCLVLIFAGIVLCDMRAHIIPYETCLATLFCGAWLRFHLAGLAGLAESLLCALAVVGLFSAINRLARRRAGRNPIGGGDVRLAGALAFCCGCAGTLAGSLACYLAAALVSVVLIAAKRIKPDEALPMAPFFTLWALVGIASCLPAL